MLERRDHRVNGPIRGDGSRAVGGAAATTGTGAGAPAYRDGYNCCDSDG
jgi:hypothetical protein